MQRVRYEWYRLQGSLALALAFLARRQCVAAEVGGDRCRGIGSRTLSISDGVAREELPLCAVHAASLTAERHLDLADPRGGVSSITF